MSLTFVDRHLRAEGNLSYLEFIGLVEQLWSKAHPDVPFYAVGTQKEKLKYPCLLYKLEMREPVSGEKKPRYREGIPQLDTEVTVKAWRFQNIVQFIALDDQSPKRADYVIESFEDFMLEHTPVFKRLGLSDIWYGRRERDGDNRSTGNAIAERTISYMIITEKVFTTSTSKLKQIEIEAREILQNVTEEIDETNEESIGIRSVVSLNKLQNYSIDVLIS